MTGKEKERREQQKKKRTEYQKKNGNISGKVIKQPANTSVFGKRNAIICHCWGHVFVKMTSYTLIYICI